MCIYITVMAKSSDKDLVSNILIDAGRRAEVVENTSLRKVIGEDEIQLLTTNGHCDCDTALGNGSINHSTSNFEAELPKLRRKKWSQAKIDKYIQNRQKAEEKKARSRIDQGSDSLEMWEAVITKAHEVGVSSIGLFYIMYNGGIETEVFEPSVRRVKSTPPLKAELESMAENQILYFS